MSISHSSSIITNGLVHNYDFLSSKIFKGEPTENVIPDGDFSNRTFQPPYSSIRVANYSFEVDSTAPIGDTVIKQEVTGVDSYTSPYSGVSGNLASAAEGEVWTASIYVKSEAAANVQLYIFPLDVNNNIFGYTNLSVQATTSWQRLVHTLTMPAGTEGIATRFDNDSGSGSVTYWNGWQLEKKDHATPFTEGIRTKDDALIDVISGLTTRAYNGSVSTTKGLQFDGVDDYFEFNQPNLTYSPNSWSVEGVIKPENKASFFVSPYSSGIDHFFNYDPGGQRVGLTVTEASDTNQRTRYAPSNSAPIGVWTHFVIQIDGLNIYIYINGELVSSWTETISIADWSGHWRVGGRAINSHWYQGEVGLVRLYNRVLNASEVKNNFEAVRGRYGL